MRGWLSLAAALFVGCVPAVAPTSAPTELPAVAATGTSTLTPVPSSPAAPTPTPLPSPSTVWLYGLPRADLTPGVANPAVGQANITSTICVKGWTATIRPPVSYTSPLKERQISEYGYADTNPADFEEDHLIALELGGDPSDPHNLWPEPRDAALPDGTPIGAAVKDGLENELRVLVCLGELPLTTAQHAIASNWVTAWETLSSGGSLAASPAP